MSVRPASSSVTRRELRAGVGFAFVVMLLATAVARAQPDSPSLDVTLDATNLDASGLPPVSVTELERLAGELRSDEATVRAHAIDRLGTLPASALPAITDRVRYLARLVIPPEDGEETLDRFRHATGSRRADDMIDLAPGIPTVLAEDRGPVVGRVAERVLLIRSLERIGTLDAWRTLADVYALSPEMWRWELRRAVARVGPRLLPAVVLARGHRDASLRRWAREGAQALGLTNPADAFQNEDLAQLTQLVLAYSEVRDLDAMPVIVGLVDHPDPPLRDAARVAMERYAQNGIWQLRIAFRNKLQSEADIAWGWRRTMSELWSRLDDVRLAPQSERIDVAKTALTEGRTNDALRELELVLRETPTPPRIEEVASMLATIAGSLDAEEAMRVLRRALWLAPGHAEAPTWQARLALAEAEQDRARGVLDLEAYEAAAAVLLSEAERARVAAVLETDDAEELTQPEREPTSFPWGALAVLALLTLALTSLLPRTLRWARSRRRADATEHEASVSVARSAVSVSDSVSVARSAVSDAVSDSVAVARSAVSDAVSDSVAVARSADSVSVARSAGSVSDSVVRGAVSDSVCESDSDAPSAVSAALGVSNASSSALTHARALARPLGALLHRAVTSLRDLLAPHLRKLTDAVRAKLSPPLYGPAPKQPKAARPPTELDPSLVLAAFGASGSLTRDPDSVADPTPLDARADAHGDAETDEPDGADAHETDDDDDDDESFDFDIVAAALAPIAAHDTPSDDTLADLVFSPARPAEDLSSSDAIDADLHDPSDDDATADADRSGDDPDAVLARLLLGASPNDTLPGAPAPQD